jgi:flagellar hook-associated protein 1 FlgK
MASTFGSFEAAKTGLSVSMQQLNLTEQNIANVNTAGYTRQRIQTSAKEPAVGSYLIAQLNKAAIGQGVEVTGIQQIRSSYLDQQYRNLNSTYNYSSTRSDGLTYLDGLFNELNEDSSLSTAINHFFTALNTFSSDTSSKEYRTNVQQQAQSMTESFRNVYEEMQSLWRDQNDSVGMLSQKINSLAQKIASLNDSIAKSEQTVGTANDLNDERNLLLDELSGYVNITYGPNASNGNMIDVTIGGLSLVDGKTANQIALDSASNHKTDIDTLLTQIAGYNAAPGANAGNLAAARAMLSSYGNFTFTTNGTGGTDVALGGAALVTGTDAVTVEDAAASSLGAWVELNRNNMTLGGSSLSIDSGTLTGGQLYADVEMMTNQTEASPGIPYYMNQLNLFVQDMAKNLNDINQSGYTYPYGTNPSQPGGNIFKIPSHVAAGVTVYDYDKLTAGNFALSDEVLASPYNIAGSSTPIDLTSSSTQAGNNEVALKLFNDLQNSGYYDKLNSIVVNLAITSNTTSSIMSTKKSLLDSVDNQRKSTSAVSLDEETTNLIIFQQSYNAAARVITTLDDMLNTMINKMGIT